MSELPDGERPGGLDLPQLAGRLRVVTGVLGALAMAGTVVDGLLHGLTFALMARWAAGFVLVLVLVVSAVVAWSALRGAGTARRRAPRRSGDA